MIIDIATLQPSQKQAWLQHAIGPRPIAFASTINSRGTVNLSPFSFFNMFSIDPPVVIFSPSRRLRDNTTKHTLENIREVPEVVINICDFEMVQQVSLSSCEYAKEVDEFIKAGFIKEPALVVKPPMVKEAKIKLECAVLEIKPLGNKAGSGMLVIAEVLSMHVDDGILNKEGTMIDQLKMHHIARLGGEWYASVNEHNLFKIKKPEVQTGIGFDALPSFVRNSNVLTGNHLALLAGVPAIPVLDEQFSGANGYPSGALADHVAVHQHLKQLLETGNTHEAWQVILSITKEKII